MSVRESRLRKLASSSCVHIVLIAILGILAYSNTFDSPFFFDDEVFINNPDIKSIRNIPSMFIKPEGKFASRPLVHATVALNYYFDEFNTRGYHAINLGLHLINGILLYFLTLMTGKRMGYQETDLRPVAVFASLIFVLHPVQTEAVTYIVSRSMLFATTFYISGMMLFLKAVSAERRRDLYIAGLFIVSLLGMGSRENFVTFPLMLILYDLFLISRFRLGEAASHYRAYLPVLLSLGYLVFLSLGHTYLTSTDVPETVPNPDYFRTQFNIHWTYLRLFVLPINQNLDYDYPIAKTIFEFPTLLSFLGYVVLWTVAVALSRRKPLLSFSIFWFVITLLPISFIVTLMDLRLDDVLFEHRLYLPSVGLIGLLAAGAFAALERLKGKKARTAVVSLLVIMPLVMWTASYMRNAVWQSNITMWADVVRKSPSKPRGHYQLTASYNNLGTTYLTKGLIDKAEEYFKSAIFLNPGYADAHCNLGFVYNKKGLPEKAAKHFRYALNARPNFPEAHFGLAMSLKAMGLKNEAMRRLKIASNIRPYPSAHYNLGIMYMESGDIEKAKEEFRRTLTINPGHHMARRFLEDISGPMKVSPH
jgi:tetratricopeptide (TPR) repeat protein